MKSTPRVKFGPILNKYMITWAILSAILYCFWGTDPDYSVRQWLRDALIGLVMAVVWTLMEYRARCKRTKSKGS